MKKAFVIGVATIIAGGIGIWQFAEAQGGENSFGFLRSLEQKADVLDITTEELTTRLENETLPQIIEESGISSEEWHARMKENMQQKWQNMGLSEEEVAARKQQMEERHGDCEGGEQMGTRRLRNGPRNGWWKE